MTRTTICLERGCPDLVTVGDCPCWEHLRDCASDACEDPAHYCEAGEHFCVRHRPGVLDEGAYRRWLNTLPETADR